MMRSIVTMMMVSAIAACQPTRPEPPAGDPLVIGPVESIQHHATASGVLVRAAPGSLEPCGIQATADESTRVLTRTPGGRLELSAIGDVAVGDTVEVYVDGPVAESCPVQGEATAIVRVASGAP